MRPLIAPAIGAAAALVLTSGVQPAGADDTTGSDARVGRGFHTSAPAMLKGTGLTTTQPLLTVGEVVKGYEFAALPDGISMLPKVDENRVDILLNHETSKVPFPATRADNVNSILSKITLDTRSAGVRRGSYAIPSSEGWQRFCSNFLATAAEGFRRDTLFTTEEARDVVRRQEDSWAPGLAVDQPNTEQAGVVVAYDTASGRHRPIYGMGRFNHENAVGMRNYGHPVVLSGDDTFDAPASQLYMYTADSRGKLWRDEGQLWAFKSTVKSVNDYGDLDDGDKVTGLFIKVPKEIATGYNAAGLEIKAADYGYPAPPSGIPDGPQWVLEQWSNEHNAFQFIRIEDLATDRNDDRVLYFADTGEPRAIDDPKTTRLMRGSSSTKGSYMNGRIFKMTLGKNPARHATLEILADFDNGGYNNVNEVHQPDNVETTNRAIYVTEDPGSHNKGVTNARVWRIGLKAGKRRVVAVIDQSSAPTTLTPGEWETSGITDVSSVFGKGAFLINVQAHGWDEKVADPAYPGGPTSYREKGQMLLMRVGRP